MSFPIINLILFCIIYITVIFWFELKERYVRLPNRIIKPTIYSWLPNGKFYDEVHEFIQISKQVVVFKNGNFANSQISMIIFLYIKIGLTDIF